MRQGDDAPAHICSADRASTYGWVDADRCDVAHQEAGVPRAASMAPSGQTREARPRRDRLSDVAWPTAAGAVFAALTFALSIAHIYRPGGLVLGASVGTAAALIAHHMRLMRHRLRVGEVLA